MSFDNYLRSVIVTEKYVDLFSEGKVGKSVYQFECNARCLTNNKAL